MIPLFDTHQHLIYPEVSDYAWTEAIPALAKKPFSVTDYLELTKAMGVSGSLFMEVDAGDSAYKSEAQYIARLMEDPSHKIMGIVASCRPESDEGYDAWLEESTSLPVVGFRRILHVMDDGVSQSDTFVKNVRKIGSRDLTFDMCFLARQLPVAVKLAKACNNTSLVLDHCGVPDIVSGDIECWKADIKALADLPHVACKISGVLAYCPAGKANLAEIRPYLDHVLSSFGADRVLWGSDWPVVNLAHGLRDWLSVTREFMSHLSADEAEKFGYKNAERIYGVAVQPPR